MLRDERKIEPSKRLYTLTYLRLWGIPYSCITSYISVCYKYKPQSIRSAGVLHLTL